MSISPTPASPAAQDGREIEWQLATEDLAPVRRWLAAHRTLDGVRIDPLGRQSLCDTYLDTADWRVFRSGFALRVRQVKTHVEATLKSLRSARADLADRREITEPLPGGATQLGRAPGPVGAWLNSRLGERPLWMLFMARTLRERFVVRLSGAAEPAAEIALDETSLLGPAQEQLERLLRVEVEVRAGAPEPLAPLVDALRRAGALEPATENKFAAGVRAAALAPPRD